MLSHKTPWTSNLDRQSDVTVDEKMNVIVPAKKESAIERGCHKLEPLENVKGWCKKSTSQANRYLNRESVNRLILHAWAHICTRLSERVSSCEMPPFHLTPVTLIGLFGINAFLGSHLGR